MRAVFWIIRVKRMVARVHVLALAARMMVTMVMIPVGAMFVLVAVVAILVVDVLRSTRVGMMEQRLGFVNEVTPLLALGECLGLFKQLLCLVETAHDFRPLATFHMASRQPVSRRAQPPRVSYHVCG